MDKKYKDLFDSLNTEKQCHPAVHMDHEDIDDNASELLSGIFGRNIYAEGKRSDFYDWGIKIFNEPISEAELEILYEITGATDYDKEIQSYETEDEDGGSITELCQRIAQKLFSKIMPFEIAVSHSDEEGIWLFGELTDSYVIRNDANK